MRYRTVLRGSFGLLATTVAALAGGYAWLQTDDGGRWLADRIEAAASTAESRLAIGGLSGAIPWSPIASAISLSDAAGPWLTLDHAAFQLDPMALLDGEVRFVAIKVGRMAMARPPSAPDPTTEDRPAAPFAWPSLPVTLNIERLDVDDVSLGAAFPGGPARFRIEGAARLGDFRDGLSLDLSAVRTDDARGVFTVEVRFHPSTGELTTGLRLDESDGGILTRLLDAPALPALTIDLSGDGTLDDWRAELTVDGGIDLRLVAPVAITAEETGHRVTVEAKGRLAALVDDTVRPLFETETTLGASVLVGADERLRTDRFQLAGGFGVASLTGELDLRGETVDVAVTLVPAGPSRFARLTDAASWSGLRLSGTATGTLLEPKLALSLAGDLVTHGDFSLQSLVATFDAAVAGPLMETGSRIDVAADLTLEGLEPGAGFPPGLLGPQVRTVVRGAITPTGSVVVDSLMIDAPAARLVAEGAGEGWGVESASFVGTLDIPDLFGLGNMADRSFAGRAAMGLAGEWNGTRAALRASAELEDLSTSIFAVDRLLGDAPMLSVAASFGADGMIDVESLALCGIGVEMSASGAIGVDALDIDWRASLSDLAVVDPSLEGTIAAAGRFGGTRDDPTATARLTLTDAILADYTVSGAQLDATIRGLTARPVGDVALKGSVAGLPARATAELHLEDEGAIRIDKIALVLASLVADGAVTLDAGTLSGEISAGVGDLRDLSPLIGKSVSGQVDADLSLSQLDGRQMVDARVSVADVGLPGMAKVERTELTLQLTDGLTTPDIAARLHADGILAGPLALERATATAEGNLDALTVVLDLADGLLTANASADVAFGEGETRIDVVALAARYAGAQAALAGPGRVTLLPDAVLVDGMVLQAEGGWFSADGRYGDTSDLAISMADVPLELARLAVPDLDVSGQLDGRFRLAGTRAAPRATGDLRATGVTHGALREAGIAGLDLSMVLDWNGDLLSLSAAVDGDFGGPVMASAALSASPDPATGLPSLDQDSSVTGRVSGTVRLGLLNDLLAARGDRVDGTIAADLTLSGSMAGPRVGGRIELTAGSYRNALVGVSLDDIRLHLNGDGDRLTIAELSAKAPNGGAVRATGSIGIDRDAGFPADISFGFDDALMIDSEIVRAEVRGKMGIAGALTQSLDLIGRLTVVEAEIRLPERLPPSIQTLDVVEINVPPELEARRPISTPAGAGIGPPLQIALDLAIDAPGRIFVRGRGLYAEVGGDVTVTGGVDAPEISGGFELRRGHLDLLGRRFNFDEGVVTLPEDGSIDADIRFAAHTSLNDASAQITVSGRASAPQIRVESVPELPQDEILARILFGKRASSLSALESIQLARSAFQLTGIGAGPGARDSVRNRLGLDEVDVRQPDGGQRGSTLNLRGRIAERINLDVQQGLRAGSGQATVDLELSPNVSVETEVGVNSTGRVGVSMEWEY